MGGLLPHSRTFTGVPAIVDDLFPIAQELGNFACDAAARTTGSSVGYALGLSTFSGHGCQVGQLQNFDTVSFRIYPHDAAYLPTFVRVRVLSVDSAGSVLADVVVPVTTEYLTPCYVQAELGAVITNAGNTQIWIEFHTDGRCGYENIFPVVYDSARHRYSSTGSISSLTTAANSTAANIWFSIENTGTINQYQTGVPTTSIQAVSGTSTGWGCPVGILPKFNRLQFVLHAIDASVLPAQCRVRIRSINSTGSILATRLVGVSFTTTGGQVVTVDFDADVDPAGGQCWFEFMCDGRVSSRVILPGMFTTPTYPSAAYSTNRTCESVMIANSGTQHIIWIRTQLRNRDMPRRPLTGSLARLIRRLAPSSVTANFAPTTGIALPSRIPCVVGFESNIYWDGLLRTRTPHSNYQIDVVSMYGRQDSLRWRFTPSGGDVGSQSLSVGVSYNGTQLVTAATTLVVKSNTVGAGVTRKCLVIGDSTTAGGGVTQQIIDNLAVDSSTYAVTLIGTRGAGANKHEGISGKTVAWFYADATSPFVFSGSFNFSTYLSTNSLSMSSGDSVFILLGINDVSPYATDATLSVAFGTMVTQLNAMITNIQSAVSGVNVWIGLTIPPSASQDSFGNNYACDNTRDNYAWSVASWRERIIVAFDGRTGSNVYISPIGLNLDTVNNMTTTLEAANARNATLIARQSNGVHPAASGYSQIGDVLYCCLMSLES